MDQINRLFPVIFIKLCLKHSFNFFFNTITFCIRLIYYPFEQCFARNVSTNSDDDDDDESDNNFVVVVASNNGSTKFLPFNQSGSKMEKFPDVQSFDIDGFIFNLLYSKY